MFALGGGLFEASAENTDNAADTATSTANSAVDALRKEIEAKTSEIKELEALAEKYRQTIATTEKQANTLKNDIAKINTAIYRLQNEIKSTKKKIERANLEITSLKLQIDETGEDIDLTRRKLREVVRGIAESDSERPLEILLKHSNFSEFFTKVEAAMTMQDELYRAVSDLKELKTNLSEQKSTSEVKVAELSKYTSSLKDKQVLQVSVQKERAKLLEETKNEERRYQELLAETERKRQALESEILSYENKIKFTLDPNSIPKTGTGVLGWPVALGTKAYVQCGKNVLTYLTQCFGYTSFAAAGGYNGKGHNGIDLRADSGTELFAADAGVVRAVGNTDDGCARASYGRWILVDHPNGLATLYAHLSLAKVSPGQSVTRGQLIGYSGKTGYATGPHLHFTVFAKNAVEIGTLKSKVCGRDMRLPLSPVNGYLNPLSYL